MRALDRYADLRAYICEKPPIFAGEIAVNVRRQHHKSYDCVSAAKRQRHSRAHAEISVERREKFRVVARVVGVEDLQIFGKMSLRNDELFHAQRLQFLRKLSRCAAAAKIDDEILLLVYEQNDCGFEVDVFERLEHTLIDFVQIERAADLFDHRIE